MTTYDTESLVGSGASGRTGEDPAKAIVLLWLVMAAMMSCLPLAVLVGLLLHDHEPGMLP